MTSNHRGHAPLVARQRGALGEGRRRPRAAARRRISEESRSDRPAGSLRWLSSLQSCACAHLLLDRAELAGHARLQGVDDDFFSDGSRPDQHHDAVAEDHDKAGMHAEGHGVDETGAPSSSPDGLMRSPSITARIRSVGAPLVGRARRRVDSRLIGVHDITPALRSLLRPCRSTLRCRMARPPSCRNVILRRYCGLPHRAALARGSADRWALRPRAPPWLYRITRCALFRSLSPKPQISPSVIISTGGHRSPGGRDTRRAGARRRGRPDQRGSPRRRHA